MVGGEWVDAVDGNTMEVLKPAAGNVEKISFTFAGADQICVAGLRVRAQGSIFDVFVDGRVRRIEKILLGGPMRDEVQMGPIATL